MIIFFLPISHLQALLEVEITLRDGHVLLHMHPTLQSEKLTGGLVAANNMKGATVYGYISANTKLTPVQVTAISQMHLRSVGNHHLVKESQE